MKSGQLVVKDFAPVMRFGEFTIDNLENSVLNFWDIENQQNYDTSSLKGHIFAIGNLELANSKLFKSIFMSQDSEQHYYLIDTKHTDKNYADIRIAMLMGRILENVSSIKEVNFISNDRGFSSLSYALKSYGIENINFLHDSKQDVEELEKIEEFEEVKEVTPLTLKQQKKKNDNINRFYIETDKRFAVQQNSVNTSTVRKLAEKYDIDYVEMFDLLNKRYLVKLSKDNKKIKIRKK